MSTYAVQHGGRKVQTTLRLPKPLYDQAKCFAEKNESESINDFIVNALSAYIKAMHRKIIDQAFCRMAEDTDYQTEALRIAEEFADSDAETISLVDQDVMGD